MPTLKTAPRALLLACLALALFCLAAFGAPDRAGAAEIAILKSADLAAYNQAVAGFKAAMPSSTTFIEYDMQGDVARGQKLARKIRASDATLLLAVGVKAALVAKLEIVLHRQFSAMRSVLPSLKRIGVLYDPEKTGHLVEEARLLAKSMGLELIAKQVNTEKEVPPALRA